MVLKGENARKGEKEKERCGKWLYWNGIYQVRWKGKFIFPSEGGASCEVIDYFLATNTVLEIPHFIHALVLKTLVSLGPSSPRQNRQDHRRASLL